VRAMVPLKPSWRAFAALLAADFENSLP
jgi:hypothetical protein